jgi:hypothetical protein
MAIMTDQEMNRADLLATHEMLKRWNEDYPTYSEEEDDENTLHYQIENVLEIKILAELSLVNVDSWIMKGAELLLSFGGPTIRVEVPFFFDYTEISVASWGSRSVDTFPGFDNIKYHLIELADNWHSDEMEGPLH